jgi:protein required for attachment to host cells
MGAQKVIRVRIVVASEGEAEFYDLRSQRRTPTLVSRLTDPLAHLHDRDFKSDRPGRVFDHAAPAGGRRGAVARHGTGGERRPRRHEAALFARRVAEWLEQARAHDEFDRLVVMAAPRFLGLLRRAMPQSLRSHVAVEVRKDLVHGTPDAVRGYIPQEVFRQQSQPP